MTPKEALIRHYQRMSPQSDPKWQQAVAKDILRVLSEAGFKVLSREPTSVMRAAYQNAGDNESLSRETEDEDEYWTVGWDAAE